ncbi:MAG: carotenoid biosynthesis protein [Deltaproteobacteria bacterium]|nr:carotenoid biosynthesis protein [Deltaproteobacteria bacterium]
MEGPPGIIARLNFFRGLAIIYAVGLAGHLITPLRPLMLAITPYVLLITGGIVLVPVIKERNWRVFAWLLGAGVITFFIEVVGVSTGKIFGSYSYTDVLGARVLGVPPLIGFNWMLVLFGCGNLAQIISQRAALRIAIAILCAPLFDYVMEPVAVAFNYWGWQGGAPPMQNYIIWGLISGVMCSLYLLFRCNTQKALPAYYLAIQLAYFFILKFIV